MQAFEKVLDVGQRSSSAATVQNPTFHFGKVPHDERQNSFGEACGLDVRFERYGRLQSKKELGVGSGLPRILPDDSKDI